MALIVPLVLFTLAVLPLPVLSSIMCRHVSLFGWTVFVGQKVNSNLISMLDHPQSVSNVRTRSSGLILGAVLASCSSAVANAVQ